MFLKDKVTAAENRTELLRQLGQQDRRLHKARELLLMEDIDIKDFQIIKANYEHRVAEINDTLEQYPDYTAKFERSIENKGNHLLDLLGFYRVADITIQRKLIGHLFPDNVIFDGQTLEFPLNKNGFQLMYKRMWFFALPGGISGQYFTKSVFPPFCQKCVTSVVFKKNHIL